MNPSAVVLWKPSRPSATARGASVLCSGSSGSPSVILSERQWAGLQPSTSLFLSSRIAISQKVTTETPTDPTDYPSVTISRA